MGFWDYWRSAVARAVTDALHWYGIVGDDRRPAWGKVSLTVLVWAVAVGWRADVTTAGGAILWARAIWQGSLITLGPALALAIATAPPKLATDAQKAAAGDLKDAREKARDAEEDARKARAALDDAERRRAAVDAIAARLPEGVRIAVETEPRDTTPGPRRAITEEADRPAAEAQNREVSRRHQEWYSGWFLRRTNWIEGTRAVIESGLGYAEAEAWRLVLVKGEVVAATYELPQRQELNLLVAALKELVEKQRALVRAPSA